MKKPHTLRIALAVAAALPALALAAETPSDTDGKKKDAEPTQLAQAKAPAPAAAQPPTQAVEKFSVTGKREQYRGDVAVEDLPQAVQVLTGETLKQIGAVELNDGLDIAGLRNVTNIQQALNDAYRALKPGGQFLCLEFSKVTSPLMAKLYDLHSFHVIPTIGALVTKDRDSYQYLVESIRMFPKQEALKQMMEKAGFARVSYENLTMGVVAIHRGWKI